MTTDLTPYVVFGADPEFGLVTKEGVPFSAHKVLGTKENPITGQSDGNYFTYSMFRDGYGAELNVKPFPCRENLISNVMVAMQALAKHVAKKVPGSKLSFRQSLVVSESELRTAPGDVCQFGCEPSLNAYTNISSLPDLFGPTHTRRYFGGHFHVSLRQDPATRRHSPKFRDPEFAGKYVKLLDFLVALPIAAVLPSLHSASRRRYYGKAGEFRLQEYKDGTLGIEYRTLGPEVWRYPVLASFAMGVMRNVLIGMLRASVAPLSSAAQSEVRAAVDANSVDPGLLRAWHAHLKNTGLFTRHNTRSAMPLSSVLGALKRYIASENSFTTNAGGRPRILMVERAEPAYDFDNLPQRLPKFGWNDMLTAFTKTK